MAVTGSRHLSYPDDGDRGEFSIDFEARGVAGRPKAAVLRERATRRQQQRRRHDYWRRQFEDGMSALAISLDSGFSLSAVSYGIQNAQRLNRIIRERSS